MRTTTAAMAAALLLAGCAAGEVNEADEAATFDQQVTGMNLQDADSVITGAGLTTVAHDAWPAIQQTVFGESDPDEEERPLQTDNLGSWIVFGQCDEVEGGEVELIAVRSSNIPDDQFDDVMGEVEDGAFDATACDF